MADFKKMNFCTSVFKYGENVTTSEIYTQKWIELITVLERGANERKSSDILQTLRGGQEQA